MSLIQRCCFKLCFGLSALWVIQGLASEARADSTSVRSFGCDGYVPGYPTAVSVQVNPAPGVLAWAVEDSPPAGWTVDAISDAGFFDAINGKVKWGPFFDETPRVLSYNATPPAGESGAKSFTGRASFDGTNLTTTGSSSLSPDTTPPSITCPADPAPIPAGSSCQAAIPNLVDTAIRSDNCGAVSVTQTPVSGTLVGPGETEVTLTATDLAGNTAECQVTVRVVDTTPPAITCPGAPPPIPADADCQAAVPNLVSGATAADNCGAPSISQSPAAGTRVGLGDNLVTLTAVDTAGNTQTCTVTVRVANAPPIIDQGDGPLTLLMSATSVCPGDETNQLTLSAADSDSGGSAMLSWSLQTAPTAGTVSFVGDQAGASVVICYQPSGGGTGADHFMIQAADPCGGSDVISINVTVYDALHPADANSDWLLTIEEVTAYASCWRSGCTWPRDPAEIEVDYVTNCGYLWKIGEHYHYSEGEICPDCWQPGGPAGSASKLLRSIQPAEAATAAEDPGESQRIIEADPEIPGRYTVRIEATPSENAHAWALEDAIPSGCEVRELNEGGVFDATNGKVKWGPYFDNQARVLSYAIDCPGGAQGTFAGLLSVDGKSKPIAGDAFIETPDAAQIIPPVRPAACGSGQCGGGSIGMLPLTCLGLLWLRIRRPGG